MSLRTFPIQIVSFSQITPVSVVLIIQLHSLLVILCSFLELMEIGIGGSQVRIRVRDGTDCQRLLQRFYCVRILCFVKQSCSQVGVAAITLWSQLHDFMEHL